MTIELMIFITAVFAAITVISTIVTIRQMRRDRRDAQRRASHTIRLTLIVDDREAYEVSEEQLQRLKKELSRERSDPNQLKLTPH